MTQDSWLRPDCWQKASWEEQLTWPGEHFASLHIGQHVRPVDLYVYLRARFGVPNGLTMKYRAPDSDNPIQWEFGLKAEETLLRFSGANRRTEVLLAGPSAVDEGQVIPMAECLKTDFSAHGRAMRTVRRSLEHWKMAVNPYYRLDVLLKTIETRLEETKLSPPHPLRWRATSREFDAYVRSFEEWRRSALDAFHVTLFASILAPILAESFLNLVLFSLSRPELRADRNRFEQVLRSDIHERTLNLHTHCVGFERAMEKDNPAVRDFLRSTNRRNMLLHGNVDLRELVFGEVFFDLRTIPLFKDDDSLALRLVSHLSDLADPEQARAEITVAREFIETILNLLSNPARGTMERIMADSHLGWREERGIVGTLFGPIATEQHILNDGTARMAWLSRFLTGDPPKIQQLVRRPPEESHEGELQG